MNKLFTSFAGFLPFLAGGVAVFDAPEPLRVETLQSRPGIRVGSAGRGANSFFADMGGGARSRAIFVMRSILYGFAMQTTAPSECALE